MPFRPTIVRLLAGFLCLTAFFTMEAQEPVIRTNVPLVLVPVTVTDAKGKPVDGLQQDDFILYDDGAEQKQVRLDTSDTVLAPVAMVVAIQSSGISEPALARIRRAGSLIQPLVAGERGEAAVLTYDDEVRTLQQFTRDSAFITGAFEVVEPRTIKRAKLVDAVIEGVHLLETRPENYRRILLILGESRDRGSKAKLDKAVEAAQRAGVALYPVTYSAQKIAWASKPSDAPALPEAPDYAGAVVELARLTKANAADVFARATGGRHLSFTTLDGLEGAISRLGEEVHSQYLLSFAPAESRNKGYHRIAVSVKSRRDVVVRSRPGYWAQR
ncbi:MAG TPA: VWA domain-containing protein [Bryobacteraceae bacterium]|nr:VWA domain-containing protein [Bryobacteraceae bacterium]